MEIVQGTNQQTRGISAKYQYWYDNLHDCNDTRLSTELLNYIKNGFNTGVHELKDLVDNDNWPSAIEHKEGIYEFMLDRIKEGSVEILDDTEMNEHCFSPLGAFMKKGSKKLRVIHDLSYPPEKAINCHIEKERYSVKYSGVLDAVKLCSGMTEAWMAKTDLKNAYFSCPVNESEKRFLGFRFLDNFNSTINARWAALPYGLRSAAALFDLTAEGLKNIYVHNGAAPTSLYYLDDIITICPTKEDCQKSLNIILDTCTKCGFQVQAAKTVGPSQKITYLGIEIDSKTKQIRLPQEKVVEIKGELKEWLNKTIATKREILSLLGKLNFCCQVVRNGNKFTRRLIECSKKGSNLNSRIKLGKQTMRDIRWWLECMTFYNGTEWFPRDIDISTAKLTFSDASDVGLGGLCDTSWFYIPFIGDYKWLQNTSIQYRELFAAVTTIATFSNKLRYKQVIMHCDNESMQHSIESGRSKVPELMGLIRSLFFYTAVHHIDYSCIHIRSKLNAHSDRLSRLMLVEFFYHFSNADKYMSRPARIIKDF